MTDPVRYELSKALTVAAIILYIPANFLPVMTITITGQVESLTVMGGVRNSMTPHLCLWQQLLFWQALSCRW